jgi:16S rRNA (uracil1498-N3)-methyltransferase
MLQSQQSWMPLLQEPKRFVDLDRWQLPDGKKLIAHCENSEKQLLNISSINTSSSQRIAKSTRHQILIGPEGDFTRAEIERAVKLGYQPVSLGETRLRTETAGVAAAVLLCIGT